MPFVLPDTGTPFGQGVHRRLKEEYLIWLTAVGQQGMPQPAPVWFLWDEVQSNFLISNQTYAKRLDLVQKNPHVSLNFDGYGTGFGIDVFTGYAHTSLDDPPADRHQPYLAKYHHWMTTKFGSPAQFAADYTVAWRVTPMTVRGSSS